jgi:hypothetical protein
MARRISNRSAGRVRTSDNTREARPLNRVDGINHADAHLEDWRSIRRRAAHIGMGRDRATVDLAAKLMVKLLESKPVRSDVVNEARAAVQSGQVDSPAKLDSALDRMLASLAG